MRFTIYMLTCTANGKRYIGQTRGPVERRWIEHVSQSRHRKTYLGCTIKAYGSDAFRVEVLDVVRTQEGANAAEIAWIRQRNTIKPNGLNLDSGGRVTVRHPDMGRKIGEKAKARLQALSPEELAERVRKLRAGNTKEVLRARALEQQARMSPEQKRAIADKKRAQSLAIWANMTEAQRAEHGRRVSEAQKKRFAEMSPEEKSRRLRHLSAGMTSEQKSARAERVWETRRKRGG